MAQSTPRGGGVMRRKKRLTIIRVGLALAALAIPATVQAKPMPTQQDSAKYQLGPGEIPYLSQGQGVDLSQLGGASSSPDDRNVVRGSVPEQSIVIPYLSQGNGVTSAELGFPAGKASDDRGFARAERLESTPAATDDSTAVEISQWVLGGVGMAILLMMGAGLGVRRNRKTTLSPA